MTHRADRRDPEAFPVDDKRVYDAYVAGRQSAALAAGIRLGLFDLLEESPASEESVGEQLGLGVRPRRALLGALETMGLLVRKGSELALARDASAYLVRDKPGSLWGLIDMEIENFLSPATLLEALREDRSTVYGADDPWEAHEQDPERARAFTAAMHSVSERPAAGLAEVVDTRGVRSVLDVGGGSGALSIALARKHEELVCVVWDLAVVCELAREYARKADVAERVLAEPGDMFRQPFPEGHDVVLLSQILHDWPPEKGATLVQKAYTALPRGGRLWIHEKLVEEDLTPRANTLVSLDMMVWTEGQQYRESELRAMLAGAGFERVERRATAGYWSLIEAWK
ncbi:MAG: methyltransferase domain-containing protein [bacterium]|nr:methyltransferase domain-containing protein [bacterium]